jgi:rSAM/selenodomain-associated transferase 2
MTSLTVVIPARNEAERLPLLLADLAAAPPGLIAELVVVDGGSGDATARAAGLAGARVLRTPPGRGGQLRAGVAATAAPWLLLLHADARLPHGWAESIAAAMAVSQGRGGGAWCFDLAVDSPGWPLRLLELAVTWRTRLRQLPYGDQGLLLPRELLQRSGGIAPLPLMEDLDLVLRLRRQAVIHRLGLPLLVNGRRWRRLGVLGCAWRNAALRRAWRRGQDPAELARRYNAQGEYQKAQRRFWGSSSQPWAP